MQQFDDCDYFPHKHSELCWKQIDCAGSYLMVYSICESRDSIFSSKHVRIAIDRSTAPIVHSTDKVTSCVYASMTPPRRFLCSVIHWASCES